MMSWGTVEVSQWVKRHYLGFSKFLGAPIVGFEQQAMALFRTIEEKCRNQSGVGTMRHTNKSIPKGFRKIRNLVSTIN